MVTEVIFGLPVEDGGDDGPQKLASAITTMILALENCSQFMCVHCICPYQINHKQINNTCLYTECTGGNGM